MIMGLFSYTEKLIRDDKAYVDDTPSEEMKVQRENKQPSKCRDNSNGYINI